MTGPPDLAEYTQSPNALAPHYSRFQVGQRLLLTGHSHQAWPDVAFDGQAEAADDAARFADEKWDRAFARADEVRAGYRRLLDDPAGEIALGANTHELVIRFLSALDLRRRPRLVTTDGEFHTLRRQLGRLAEEEIAVVQVPAQPAETLAERLAGAVTEGTSAVLVSAVLFETARIVPHLGPLAEVSRQQGVELLVDAYHTLGPMPFPLHHLGLDTAWVTGGGYKYLQLGEGNAFLRLPAHAREMRPIVTGWFAEFDALADDAAPAGRVAYGSGASRFAGATYDPTSNYRGARVLGFFTQQGLTPDLLRALYQHQLGVLADTFDRLDLPDAILTRDRTTPLADYAGFLALDARDTPSAAWLQEALRQRGVLTDSRGPHLRLGPAPYLSDAQLETAVGLLGDATHGLQPAAPQS